MTKPCPIWQPKNMTKKLSRVLLSFVGYCTCARAFSSDWQSYFLSIKVTLSLASSVDAFLPTKVFNFVAPSARLKFINVFFFLFACFLILGKDSFINSNWNELNKLNLAISPKDIPQYCTGHPVLRIKIT